MTQKIKFRIPLVFNALPYQNYIRHSGNFRYKLPKLAEYQQYIAMIANSEKNKQKFERIEKGFQMRVHFTFKGKRHGDAQDNCLKSVADALEGVLYTDDKNCCDCRVTYCYGKEPKIEIELERFCLRDENGNSTE